MDATITTLSGVLQNPASKVISLPEIPTVWYDLNDNLQETYGLINVMFSNWGTSTAPIPGISGPDLLRKVEENDTREYRLAKNEISTTGTCTYNLNGKSVTFTVIKGELVSLGSNVRCLGPLIDHCSASITSKLFEHAYNLTDLVYTFADYYTQEQLGHCIPPDLFTGAPNLETLYYVFCNTAIQNIPNTLFSKNPKIKSVEGCFRRCNYLISVEPSLFFKQKNLINVKRLFSGCCSLEDLGDNLFDSNELRKNFSSENEFYEVFENAFYGINHKLKNRLISKYVTRTRPRVNTLSLKTRLKQLQVF